MTKNKSTILILIKSLGLGGAERLLVDSLPYLDTNQFDYHFAYLLPWKNHLVPHFTKDDFSIYCLGGANVQSDDQYTSPKPWQALTLLPRALHALNRLQRRLDVDLIHADLPVAGILARLHGRRHGIPVVYTEHNLQERYHPLTGQANRLTYGWNSHALAVSEEVAESIRQRAMDRNTQVTPLLNGVPVEQVRTEATALDELRAQLEIESAHYIVGTVAVFRRQKRLLDWVDMAAQVAAQYDNVTFLLVGDGPEMPAVRAKIAELDLTERIRLPGFRSDGRRVLALMDIYVMTSEHEGLPIALLEAMTLAKPVVATAVGGIPEVVDHDREGLLSTAGDVAQLTRHVMQLLGDLPMRKRMGRYGARKIESAYHIKHRVRAIEAIYSELLVATRPLILQSAQLEPKR